MEVRKIEVGVNPEMHDVGLAVKKILELARESSKDGFQAAEDLPKILMGSFTTLQEAMKGASLIGGNAKENPMGALRAVLNPVSEGVEAWLEA